MYSEKAKAPVRPDEEAKIRQSVRTAVEACRACDGGSDCVGALMNLFRYLPDSVRSIVEDEQTKALEHIVGGD
jgi:hypothetical protein